MLSRNLWMGVWVLTGGGLQIGCTSPGTRVDPASGEPEVLPILREHHGYHVRLRRPIRLVIRDRATYHRLPLPEVEVDFSREMLLVVAVGGMRTAEYAPRITSVRRAGSKLWVEVIRVRRPDAASSAAIRRSAPYHMVVVPRSDRNVAGFDTTVATDLFAPR